jgi:hypothetical protein
MPAVLRLDDTDVYSFLRVAPGEGFDPADQDFLEPQFSESAVGAGDPLLSIRERNREMAWPLHLSARPQATAVDNLIPNPSFEVDASGWTVNGTAGFVSRTLTRDAGWAYRGGFSGRVQFTNAADATSRFVRIETGSGLTGIPVQPSTKYTFSALTNFIDTLPLDGGRLEVRYYDATGAQILTGMTADAPAVLSSGTLLGATPAAATGISRKLATGTTPPDCAYVNLRVLFGTTTTPSDTLDVYVDGLAFTQGTISEYFDGDTPGYSWDGTAHASVTSGFAGQRNVVQAPNFEHGVGDWVAQNSAVLSVADLWSAGAGHSLKVVTPGAVVSEGARIDVDPAGWTPATPYTLGVWVYSEVACRIQPTVADGVTTFNGTQVSVPAGVATLVSFSFTLSATATLLRLSLVTSSTAPAQPVTFYIDEVLLTVGTTLGNYFDGDDLDADWAGVIGDSVSVRRTGKQGLHRMVTKLHRLCRTVAQVQWRDESAGSSTYLEPVFARFEADYSFRKAQLGYLSGVLRVYTKPYGTTGTSRLAATAAGTGVALGLPLGSVAGDAVARAKALVQTGSQVSRTARAVGAALIPSGYAYDIPAASLIRAPQATLTAASGAVGSQAVGLPHSWNGVNETRDAFQIALSPASAYAGRNRLLAVANVETVPGVLLRGFGDRGEPLGPGTVATVLNGEGWGLVDLGVLDVDPSAGQATAVAAVRTTAGIRAAGQFSQFDAVATSPLYSRVARVLVLPEDDTTLALDTRRRRLAEDGFDIASASGVVNLDSLGNPWASVPSHGALWMQLGYAGAYSPTIAGFKVWGSKLSHPTAADLLIETAHQGFLAQGIVAQASMSFALAKDNSVMPVVVRHGGVPSAYISIRVGNLDFLNGTLLASVAYSVATPGISYLSLHTKGPVIEAALRDQSRRVLATLGASHADAGLGGQAVALTTATGGVLVGMDGIRVAEVPSVSLGGRDRIEFDAVNRAVPKTTPSSVYLERVDGVMRGDFPEADPTRHAQLVALSLPIDGGVTTDLLNAEVRVRESFTYAQP